MSYKYGKADRGVSKCEINVVPKLSPLKALETSLHALGKVNIRFMERLTEMPEWELTEKLKGKIYFNPVSDNYETREKLLSGDLQKKIDFTRRWIVREEKRIKGFPGYDGIEPYIYMAGLSLRLMKSAIPKMDKELSGILRQHDEMKRKHPDAILLFRVKDTYMTFKDDAVRSAEILGVAASDRQFEKGQIAKTASFPHEALDTFLPKLVRAGMRVAICEQLDDSRQKKVENNIPSNNNHMPRKKKEETPKEEQPKVQAKEPKAEAKTEAKAEKSEQQERKPREPQMVTVNGEKVTHGHAYQSKTNPEDWFFTAKLDGQQLKPQKMDPADLAAYQSKEMTVPQLMEKYYPTKLMQRVPDVAYQVPNVLSGPGGNLTIDKFNVYKETDETRADYGKYKFYAQVGDKKMSTTASREDLNAYFDRVATPGELVQRNFGDRLHLQSHYEQFRLPEGIDPKGIRVAKDKEDGRWKVSADLGEGRGRTSRQEISFDDGYSLFKTKTATREQIAAKYLTQEISTKLAAPLSMEKSASMKM